MMKFPGGLFQLKGRKSLWLSLVLVTLLVYFTEARHGPWFVAFRYLYFIPVTLAAYFHGQALGMAVSLLCTSLFLPILAQQLVAEGLSGSTVEFIATLFLFNLWAWVAGTVGGVQRREKEFYLKLNQLGEFLDQETKVDRLLSVSLEQSLRVTGAGVGRILLRNPKQDYFLALDSASPGLRIVPASTAAEPAASSRPEFAGSQPLDRWLIARDRSLVSNQVQADPRFLHPDGGSQAVNSLVAAPIQLREEAIGLIMVANSSDGPFDSQDLHMLEAIADRTAMAVERAWLYEAEQTKRRMADMLLEVSHAVGSTLDLAEVLNLVLDCLGNVVDYDCASIQLFVNGTLQYALGQGAGSQQLAQYTGSEEFETTRQILREKMPLVIADTRQYPGWVRVPGLEYVRSWLGSPMLIKDQVIGILAVRKAQSNYYGSEDAQVVFALANQVAIAVENARLYEEARQRVDELEALRRTSLQLTSSLDLTAVLDSVTESALMLVKATDCHIYVYNEESGTFTFGSALWDDGRREPAVQMPRSDGLTATVARGGEPVVINDVPHHPLFMTREAQKWDLQAIVGFPLKRAGHVLGVFTIAFQQPHTFSEEELRVLGLLADQAAIAIENARLYAASERRVEEMASLYEMGLATTSTLELDQQLRTLYSEIRRLFAPDTFAIVWYDPDAKEITVELAIEEDKCLPKSTVPLDEGGLHGWVIKNSEALLIKDMLSEADMISVEPKHITRPARSWLGVPLVTKGRVIGAMSVQSFQPYAFDEDDKRLFISIANQAAVTIENTRLLEAEHSRRLLADTLRQVSQVVNSTLKLDEVLELVLDELRKVIPYDSVSIHLLSGNMLEIISARGFEDPTRVLGLQFSMDGDNPNCHVIRSRAPYIVLDTHAAYAAFREPPHSHIRSWLGVPLLVKDEVIGMIALDKTTTGYFSQEDAEVALTFANQVAMAIENARLYEETNLLAITDELTGLFNVRYFYHELRGEILRSERYGHSCSLIFFDIDDFKIYNDRYGHLAGDDLLREMGGILKEIMRHPDTVARYGGEEFTIIQPETEQAEAVRSAQRVWRQIREHQFCVAGVGREGRITISVGVATYPGDAKTAKELVHAADMALYVAKREKDQVCVYERAQPST